LIDNGSSLKVSQDQHALFEAIKEDAYEIVVLLVKKGVSPNIVDEDGVSAFMYAIKLENFKIVSFLARHGADLFAMDDRYDMAQNYAERCKSDVIKDFITHMLVVEFEKEQKSTSPCLACATPCVSASKESP
jgi:ankyrin repeat protein